MNDPPEKTALFRALNLLSPIGITLPKNFRNNSGCSLRPSVDPTKMDLQNIAIHELGHGIGLLDVYEDACADVTMYGYGTEGETKKRTLETPDITGYTEMY